MRRTLRAWSADPLATMATSECSATIFETVRRHKKPLSLKELSRYLPARVLESIGCGLREFFERHESMYTLRRQDSVYYVTTKTVGHAPVGLCSRLIRVDDLSKAMGCGVDQSLDVLSGMLPLIDVIFLERDTEGDVTISPRLEARSYVKLKNSVATVEHENTASRVAELNAVPQDHDAYRCARLVRASSMTPLRQFMADARAVTAFDPVTVVLSYPYLFAVDDGARPRRVQYRVLESYLPAEYDLSKDDVERRISKAQEDMDAAKEGRNSSTRSNYAYVQKRNRWRHLCRVKLLQEELVPHVDPNVLFHHLFDVLGEEPVEPPEALELLPPTVSARLTLSRKLVERYPHLLKWIYTPPRTNVIQRADVAVDTEYTVESILLEVQSALHLSLERSPTKWASISMVSDKLPSDAHLYLSRNMNLTLRAFLQRHRVFEVQHPPSGDILVRFSDEKREEE